MLPWTRAPLLLFRQPGLLLAIAAGAFVAVLPAAAAPLFLSSARTATLHHQLDNTCAAKAGFELQSRLVFRDAVSDNAVTRVDPATATANYGRRRAAVAGEVAATPGMAAPTTTLFAATAVAGARRGGQEIGALEGGQVWIAGREGVTSQLTPTRGPDGEGVWIPESLAAAHGLNVGDELRFATLRLAPSNNGPPVDPAAPPAPVRIAAVYPDLTDPAKDEYWCTLQTLYGYQAGAEMFDSTILPVIYTDVATVLRVGVTSTLNIANEYLDVPLADERPTVSDAHVMAGRIDGMRTRILREYPSGGTFRPTVLTSVGRSADRAELVYDTLRDTTTPATAAGVLIGLIVVAAAAVYWVQRREREVRLLAAHGVAPAALAGKAVLESVLSLAVGALAALVAAGALVRAFGPSPLLSGEAWPFALMITGCGLAVVVVVSASAAGLRVRRMVDAQPRRRRLRLRWLPWELLPAGLAALTWWLLGGDAERVGVIGAVAHVPLRLVVVPVLGFLALVGLGARLGAYWITRSSPRGSARRPGLFLALRRIARPVAASVLLGAVTAIPVAMTGFGATVTDSIRRTLDAKAAVILGSDTVATLDREVPVPPQLAGRATPVLRLTRVLVGGVETDVVGIDPATFAQGAFWSGQLPGPSLDDLVSDLTPDGPEPAGISYGSLPAGTHDVKVYGERMFSVSVRTTGLLPGSQGGYPVLLVHRDALGQAARYAVPQLWIRGDPATAATDLARAGLPVRAITATADTFGDSLYEPVTYTFRYLIALNLFAGLVVAAGLLLYVEARTPLYRRGYVLLRRLGLRRRAHVVALVLETALPMGTGLLFGLLLAGAATAATRREIDLAPGSPPGTLIAVPTGVLLTILAVVAGIAAASSTFAHLRAVRAKPGEVLRTA